MGDKIRTIQNREIIKSDLENNLIYIKGSVPGSKNSFVLIKKTIKKIKRATTLSKSKKATTELSKASEKKSDIKKTSPEKQASQNKDDNKTAKKKDEKVKK